MSKYDRLDEIDSYFNEIKDFKPLTRAEEALLAREIKKGDQDSLDKLVTSNLKFVVNVAKNYRDRGVPFSDLIAEGNVGLIKAAKRFDETKGTRFISYAVWWIRNSISEYLEENSKFSADSVDQYVMDCVTDDEGKFEYDGGVINSEFESRIIDTKSRGKALESLFTVLKEREVKVLTLYFGLYGNKEMTLDEIGGELNITQERVRQIKEKALVKMKSAALMSDEFYVYETLI